MRSSLALVLLCVALAGCGDRGGADAAEAPQPPTADAQPLPEDRHVHGLAVDPDDGALLIATHTGLWRAEQGTSKATRVGEDASDYMGFTITARGDYLASGHPAAGAAGPPALGLLRSTDDGRSWKPLSLSGQADFHAVRARGDRVYGADTMTGWIFASGDRGRTWGRRRAPAPVIDLAVHPDRPDEVLATTEAGVARSTDAARTWRPVTDQQVGLLAWPEPDRVLLVDGPGRLHVSADGGTSWSAAGDVGGQPVAFAVDGDDLYVALVDGTVKRSGDGGRTWDVRATI